MARTLRPFSGAASVLAGVIVLFALASWSTAEDRPADKEIGDKEQKVSRDEQAIIERVNEERRKQKLAPLTIDPTLMAVARGHTENMARLNKMSHELEGKTPADRLDAAGYKSIRSGENVAEGYPTPAKVVEGWMNSPGHRANILNPDFTHAGTGMVRAGSGRNFFTLVLAKPFPKRPN